MLAAFGVDTLSPRTTLRRVWSLLRRLPPGSYPDQDHAMAWTNEAHLLAGVFDSLAVLTSITLRGFGAKNVAKPKPVPRPGDRKATAKLSGWRDLANVLSGQQGVVTRRG